MDMQDCAVRALHLCNVCFVTSVRPESGGLWFGVSARHVGFDIVSASRDPNLADPVASWRIPHGGEPQPLAV